MYQKTITASVLKGSSSNSKSDLLQTSSTVVLCGIYFKCKKPIYFPSVYS
jgi:hypothetical protein